MNSCCWDGISWGDLLMKKGINKIGGSGFHDGRKDGDE